MEPSNQAHLTVMTEMSKDSIAQDLLSMLCIKVLDFLSHTRRNTNMTTLKITENSLILEAERLETWSSSEAQPPLFIMLQSSQEMAT